MASVTMESVQRALDKALSDEEEDSFEKIDYLNQSEDGDKEQKDKIAKLESELADARKRIEYYRKKCLTLPQQICLLLSVVFMSSVAGHVFVHGTSGSCSAKYISDQSAFTEAPAAAPTFECPKIPECPAVPKCAAAKCPIRTCGNEKMIKLENGDSLQLTDGNSIANVTGSAATLRIGGRALFVNGEDTSEWSGERLITAGNGQTTDVELIVNDNVWGDLNDNIGWMFMLIFLLSPFINVLLANSKRREATERSEIIEVRVEENSGEATNEDSDGLSDDDEEEEEDDENEQELESDEDSDSEEEDNEESASEDINQQVDIEDNKEEDDEREATEVIDQQAVAIEDNKVELELFQSRVASAHVDWMVLNAQVEMLKKTRDELMKKNAELEEKHKAPVEQRTWLEQTLDESLVPENGG